MKLDNPKSWPEHWWRWRCRRGVLELDVVFDRFIKAHLSEMSELELNLFAALIEHTDGELQGWLVNNEPSPKKYTALVKKIKAAQG